MSGPTFPLDLNEIAIELAETFLVAQVRSDHGLSQGRYEGMVELLDVICSPGPSGPAWASAVHYIVTEAFGGGQAHSIRMGHPAIRRYIAPRIAQDLAALMLERRPPREGP